MMLSVHIFIVKNLKGGFCSFKKDWQHHQVPCWIPDAKLTFVIVCASALCRSHCTVIQKFVRTSSKLL